MGNGERERFDIFGLTPAIISVDPNLIQRVIDSPAVQELAGMPRYDPFIAEGVSPDQWIAMLDGDFDNRHHLFKTAVLAEAICALEGADEITTQNVVLTALIHDAAESKLGDTNYNEKTVEDDTREIDLIGEMIDSGDLFLTRTELAISKDIMNNKHGSSPLTEAGRLFDMSERYGYMISGVITAWEVANDLSVEISPQQRKNLRCLAANVLFNQLFLVDAYALQGYASAHYFMREIRPAAKEIAEYFRDEANWSMYLGKCQELGWNEVANKHHVLRNQVLEYFGLEPLTVLPLADEAIAAGGAVVVAAVFGHDR